MILQGSARGIIHFEQHLEYGNYRRDVGFFIPRATWCLLIRSATGYSMDPRYERFHGQGVFDLGSFRPDAMGIRENMNTGIWTYIKSIDPRRFEVIDEKMGIVLGLLMFNHAGNVRWADVQGWGGFRCRRLRRDHRVLRLANFSRSKAEKFPRSKASPYLSSTDLILVGKRRKGSEQKCAPQPSASVSRG